MHLWAYRDLNHRVAVRAKVAQDPEWQAFLGKGTSLLSDAGTRVTHEMRGGIPRRRVIAPTELGWLSVEPNERWCSGVSDDPHSG